MESNNNPSFAEASEGKQPTSNNQQTQAPKPPTPSEEDMLIAIYENTRKTKNYMKWQLYITIILVVLPLLAMVVIVPLVFKSLSSVYGGAGLQ